MGFLKRFGRGTVEEQLERLTQGWRHGDGEVVRDARGDGEKTGEGERGGRSAFEVELMRDWVDHRIADEYAMSTDWDNRWRTGGSVDEVLDEAHLSQEWILKGIERFTSERKQRLARIKEALEGVES